MQKDKMPLLLALSIQFLIIFGEIGMGIGNHKLSLVGKSIPSDPSAKSVQVPSIIGDRID